MADTLVIDGPLCGEHVSYTGDNFFHRRFVKGLDGEWWDRGEAEILVYRKFKVAYTDGTRWEHEFVYATSEEAVDEWCRKLTERKCR
jgi:hypothetical protein